MSLRQLDIGAWSAGERSGLKIYNSEWRLFKGEGCRRLPWEQAESRGKAQGQSPGASGHLEFYKGRRNLLRRQKKSYYLAKHSKVDM